MADDKTKLPSRNNVLGSSALSGKTVTGAEVYLQGSVVILEVSHAAATRYFKVKGFEAKIGTTTDWDEGTKVL